MWKTWSKLSLRNSRALNLSFAVRPDFKSQAGTTISFEYGKGLVQSVSINQKLHRKSIAEAELIGVNNMSLMIQSTKLLLEAQGYDIKKKI